MVSSILPKNRTKCTQDTILSAFCSFFGRFQETIICFRDGLTFSQVIIFNIVILQSNERKVVTIRSGSSGMPILPKDSGNILRLALPTSSDNRIQKTQRIILPSQISESVKVVEATGTSHLPLPAHLAHLAQPRKVHEIRLKLLKTFTFQESRA